MQVGAADRVSGRERGALRAIEWPRQTRGRGRAARSARQAGSSERTATAASFPLLCLLLPATPQRAAALEAEAHRQGTFYLGEGLLPSALCSIELSFQLSESLSIGSSSLSFLSEFPFQIVPALGLNTESLPRLSELPFQVAELQHQRQLGRDVAALGRRSHELRQRR